MKKILILSSILCLSMNTIAYCQTSDCLQDSIYYQSMRQRFDKIISFANKGLNRFDVFRDEILNSSTSKNCLLKNYAYLFDHIYGAGIVIDSFPHESLRYRTSLISLDPEEQKVFDEIRKRRNEASRYIVRYELFLSIKKQYEKDFDNIETYRVKIDNLILNGVFASPKRVKHTLLHKYRFISDEATYSK